MLRSASCVPRYRGSALDDDELVDGLPPLAAGPDSPALVSCACNRTFTSSIGWRMTVVATPAPQPPTRCFHRLLSGDAIAASRPPTSPARALAPQAPTHATILGLIQFSTILSSLEIEILAFQDQRMANSGVGLGG